MLSSEKFRAFSMITKKTKTVISWLNLKIWVSKLAWNTLITSSRILAFLGTQEVHLLLWLGEICNRKKSTYPWRKGSSKRVWARVCFLLRIWIHQGLQVQASQLLIKEEAKASRKSKSTWEFKIKITQLWGNRLTQESKSWETLRTNLTIPTEGQSFEPAPINCPLTRTWSNSQGSPKMPDLKAQIKTQVTSIRRGEFNNNRNNR